MSDESFLKLGIHDVWGSGEIVSSMKAYCRGALQHAFVQAAEGWSTNTSMGCELNAIYPHACLQQRHAKVLQYDDVCKLDFGVQVGLLSAHAGE